MEKEIFYTIYAKDANGVKIIECDTSSLKAFAFPRTHIEEFRLISESTNPGVYILYNTADKNEKPIIYIGQSGLGKGGIVSRLDSHNKNKEFWNYVICFTTSNNALEGTHAKYMESALIDKAAEFSNVEFENSTGSKRPVVNPTSASIRTTSYNYFYV